MCSCPPSAVASLSRAFNTTHARFLFLPVALACSSLLLLSMLPRRLPVFRLLFFRFRFRFLSQLALARDRCTAAPLRSACAVPMLVARARSLLPN
jgi:hypothetical protein